MKTTQSKQIVLIASTVLAAIILAFVVIKNRSLVKNLKKSTSKPLSQITDGIHFHTIEADSEEDMDDIIKQLKDKGYLIETE